MKGGDANHENDYTHYYLRCYHLRNGQKSYSWCHEDAKKG